MNQHSHLEILAAAPRGESTSWTRIGTAFPTTKGQGWRLKIEFMPLGAETEILVLPPRQKADPEGEER